MSRIKNDGWQAGEVRLASWNSQGQPQPVPSSSCSVPLPLWATPTSFRTSASSLSDEFSLVNNTRWSSLSVLKKRIDGPSHLKKEDSIPKGGQAGIAKKKANFFL